MTVRLPVEVYERLRRKAFEERSTQAAIVVDAVREKLERDMGRGRKHEDGIYTLTYADGHTEDREGYGNAGMLKFARENGVTEMRGPDGHVWDDGDIAGSATDELTGPDGDGADGGDFEAAYRELS